MSNIRLEVDARQALEALSVPQYFKRLRGGVMAAAKHMQGVASRYPEQRKLKVAQYWTDKQRRFFFAALRDGRIEVPYRRGISPGSKKMDEKWNIKEVYGGTGAVVENLTPYAKYMHGARTQSKYHQGNWKTTDELAKQEEGRVREIVTRSIFGQ